MFAGWQDHHHLQTQTRMSWLKKLFFTDAVAKMWSDLDKQTPSSRNEDAHIETTSGQGIVWTSCKYTVLSENTMLSKKRWKLQCIYSGLQNQKVVTATWETDSNCFWGSVRQYTGSWNMYLTVRSHVMYISGHSHGNKGQGRRDKNPAQTTINLIHNNMYLWKSLVSYHCCAILCPHDENMHGGWYRTEMEKWKKTSLSLRQPLIYDVSLSVHSGSNLVLWVQSFSDIEHLCRSSVEHVIILILLK